MKRIKYVRQDEGRVGLGEGYSSGDSRKWYLELHVHQTYKATQ